MIHKSDANLALAGFVLYGFVMAGTSFLIGWLLFGMSTEMSMKLAAVFTIVSLIGLYILVDFVADKK